jgi:hypothetical protein
MKSKRVWALLAAALGAASTVRLSSRRAAEGRRYRVRPPTRRSATVQETAPTLNRMKNRAVKAFAGLPRHVRLLWFLFGFELVLVALRAL